MTLTFVFSVPFQNSGWWRRSLSNKWVYMDLTLKPLWFCQNLSSDQVKRYQLFKQTTLFLASPLKVFSHLLERESNVFYYFRQVQSQPTHSFSRTLVTKEGIRSLGGPGTPLTERWGQSTWAKDNGCWSQTIWVQILCHPLIGWWCLVSHFSLPPAVWDEPDTSTCFS